MKKTYCFTTCESLIGFSLKLCGGRFVSFELSPGRGLQDSQLSISHDALKAAGVFLTFHINFSKNYSTNNSGKYFRGCSDFAPSK